MTVLDIHDKKRKSHNCDKVLLSWLWLHETCSNEQEYPDEKNIEESPFNEVASYTKCRFYYYDTKIFGMCTIKYLSYIIQYNKRWW